MFLTIHIRKFTALAVVFFCLAATHTATAQGQPASATTDAAKTVYRIQVGAYKVIPPGKFDNLASIGPVSLDDTGKGLRRIWVGEYADREKAEKALNKVKNLGYPNAFIVSQAVQPIKPSATATQAPANNNASVAKQETVQKMEYQSIPTTPAQPTVAEPVYLIQLGAYTKYDPQEIKKYSNILDLGQLLMETENEKTRLYLARFTGKAAAEKALATVKQRGYSEAFLKEEK